MAGTGGKGALARKRRSASEAAGSRTAKHATRDAVKFRAPPGAATGRKNMRAADREKVILESAIRFFAERGFEGQTRELAKRIGITHSAIYRHFPSKEALVERVYEHVYLGNWQKHWPEIINDRSVPMQERLTRFYSEYANKIFNYEWVRIFIFAGLKSFGISERYLRKMMEEIGVPTMLEVRRELGLSSKAPVTAWEEELFWGMHGHIFYIALRKFVYGTPTPEGAARDALIANCVSQFLLGSELLMRDRLLLAR